MSEQLPPASPEPGTEPNLYLADCERCDEPRWHLFRLDAEYPLCLLWAFKCGECGKLTHAWEDLPVSWVPSPSREEEYEDVE